MSAANRRVERLRQPDDFRKVFALATETALTLVTVVVVSRRLSGAFQGPVEPVVPCLVATVAAVFSLGALVLWTAAAVPISSPKKRGLAAAMAVVPPLALGASLWITPSAFVAGYLAALGVAAVLCAVAIGDRSADLIAIDRVRATFFQSRATNRSVPGGAGGSSASVHASAIEEPHWRTSRQWHPPDREPTAETPVVALPADDGSAAIPDDESESDPSIVQRMTRRRLADGGEVIEGAVRIDLDPAAKVGVAHLSFVPPLSSDPRAECHLLCDFDGRVRVTAARSYGLRIEARQSGEPTLSTTINVAFSAQAPPAASQAAAA